MCYMCVISASVNLQTLLRNAMEPQPTDDRNPFGNTSIDHKINFKDISPLGRIIIATVIIFIVAIFVYYAFVAKIPAGLPLLAWLLLLVIFLDYTHKGVYYQNVRGINTKFKDLKDAFKIKRYPIICFTETMLNELKETQNHRDINSIFEDYDIFRCDRNQKTSPKKGGGGVLIAMWKMFRGKLEPLHTSSDGDYDETEIEQIFVKIDHPFKNTPYIFGAVYLPPNIAKHKYEIHARTCERITKKYEGKVKMYVLGDYNLKNFVLRGEQENNPESLEGKKRGIRSASVLAKITASVGLRQINTIPNEQGKYLDLIFSNVPNTTVYDITKDSLLPCDIPFHGAVEFFF